LEYASWCELSRDKLPQPTDDELAAAKAIITSSPSPPTTTDAIDTASKMEAIDRIKKEIALHSGLNFRFLVPFTNPSSDPKDKWNLSDAMQSFLSLDQVRNIQTHIIRFITNYKRNNSATDSDAARPCKFMMDCICENPLTADEQELYDPRYFYVEHIGSNFIGHTVSHYVSECATRAIEVNNHYIVTRNG
jgi:hypothetical protein